MKAPIFKFSAIFSSLITVSCSSNFLPSSFNLFEGNSEKNKMEMCADGSGESGVCGMKKEGGEMFSLPPEPEFEMAQSHTLPRSHQHFNLLNEYVEQMALDISHDLQGSNIVHPITVASFVHLDGALNNTDVMGNQLAEFFITELREMGLAVSDHKITGNILVTPKGDFAFSRDIDDLKKEQKAGYVLTGTMTKQINGTLVNARVVGLTTNVVIASSSKLIPDLML